MTGKIPKITIKGAEQACEDLHAAIEALGQFEGSGKIQVSDGPGGRIIEKAGDDTRLVRLSGGTSPYSGNPVFATSDGQWALFVGTPSISPIYEENNAGDLSGEVVEIHRGKGNDWRFEYVRAGPGRRTCLTGLSGFVQICNTNGNHAGFHVVVTDSDGNTIVDFVTLSFPNTGGWFIFPGFSGCTPEKTYEITVSKSGYATLTQPLPVTCCEHNSYIHYMTASPIPTIKVFFHATDHCGTPQSAYGGGIPGLKDVVIGCGGVECTTDAMGDCFVEFPVTTIGTHYPVTATGGHCLGAYDGLTPDVVDTCVAQLPSRVVHMATGAGCHCQGCDQPRPDPLFLTDSLYGACTLHWDGALGYYRGSKTATFAGGEGCAGAPVDIVYHFLGGGFLDGVNAVYLLDLYWCATWTVVTCPPGLGQPQPHYCPSTSFDCTTMIPVPCPFAGTSPFNFCRPPDIVNDPTHFKTSAAFHTAPCTDFLNVTLTKAPLIALGTVCAWGDYCVSPWFTGASFTITE